MARGGLGAIVGAMGLVLPTVLASCCLYCGGGELQPFGSGLRLALVAGLILQCWVAFRPNLPVVGAAAGVASCLVAGCAYFEHRAAALLMERILVAETLGVAVGFAGWLAPVIGRVAGLIGWDLDAAGAWGRITGPKAILFHRGDMMIDYYLASLHMKAPFDSLSQLSPPHAAPPPLLPPIHGVLLLEHASLMPSSLWRQVQEKAGGLQRTRSVELSQFGRQGRHPACHMYPLTQDPAEWRECLAVATQMLGIGAQGATTTPGYGLTTADAEGVVKRSASGLTRGGGESRNPSMQSVVQRGGGQHIPLHLNKGGVDAGELYQALQATKEGDKKE